jgi:hypothetical protein
MTRQSLTMGDGMDGNGKGYRLTQIIMSPLFIQICKLFANSLNFNQTRIYRDTVNILYTINGLSLLAT